MEPTPQPDIPSITEIISESRAIIKASNRHFITLALFFLPLSITLIISPTVHIRENFLTLDHETVIFILIMIMIYTLSICGIATITYSAHQRFINNQVDLQTVLKSLACNFLPLTCTTIMFVISLTWFMFVGLVFLHAQKLGFMVDYNVVYIILGVVLSVIMMYLYVNWSLAYVVVVVESKWGFPALRRSSYLVKGMRFVSMFIMLYFWGGCCSMVGLFSDMYGVSNKWISVLFRAFGTFLILGILVSFTVVNTLLYSYCRVLRGELVITEVDKEFGCDYVDLPSDVEKVPRGVTVFVA